jgi:hypothetical protein
MNINQIDILMIYQALWCVGDTRVVLISSKDSVISARIFSPDRLQYCTVSYYQWNRSVTLSDSIFWAGESWYPYIALLLFLDVLDYQSEYGEALSSISWELENWKNQQQLDESLSLQGIDISIFHTYCEMLLKKLSSLWLHFLGT